MARASYQYEVLLDEVTRKRTLLIVDTGTTGKSLTNDIENVVEEICLIEELNSPLVDVIYKDSDGIWDAYDTKTRQFIPLRSGNSKNAIAQYQLIKEQRSATEQGTLPSKEK